MSSSVRFATLDGLRGLAALVVAGAHIGEVLGLGLPPHSELAVDFFFVLSGFVIAEAYGARLATSMTLANFLRIRVIRLHPLLMLGCVISLCVLVTESLSGAGPNPDAIIWAAVAAVFLIPFHTLPSPGAFPLDGPAWSLFAEYWINILFALIAPFLTIRRLCGLLLLGVAMLVLLFVLAGGIGNVWQASSIGLSILRVIYPFFAGVMLSRVYRSGKVRLPRIPALLSLTVLAAILLSPAGRFDTAFQIVMIAGVFPVLILASTHDDLRPKERQLMLLAGALSYPVYTLHFPLALVLVVPVVGPVIPAVWSKEVLAAFMCVLCAFSYLSLRYFDEPVRAWLGSRLLSRKPVLASSMTD